MSKTLAGSLAVLAAGVWMASCGGGGGNSSYPSTPTSGTGATSTPSPSATADVVITIAGMSFSPNTVAVQPGQTVAWKNTDGIAHTATADGGTFDTGAIASGATSQPIMISSSGALTYHCSIHPTMVGALNGTASGGGSGPGY